MPFRLIARLDIKGPNLVKGIHLEGLRVLGRPAAFARKYYEDGVDELFYQDAVASLYGRNSLLDIVKETAQEIFIPLCVGGGIRSRQDVYNVLRAGADKVAINTAAIANPDFIREAAEEFGSSTIVAVVEAIRQPDGGYLCFTNCGREYTGVEAVAWAKRLGELGAGEIVVTSVDREGTGRGFDLDLTRRIAQVVPIPVIAHGGCGSIKHALDVVQKGHCDAIALASILHYDAVKKIPVDLAEFADEGNTEFLRYHRQDGFKLVASTTVQDLKKQLAAGGLHPRMPEAAHV
ncbi:imidazole glycerol phosphate synthase subunit HisF [Dongia sedimenti]|uniref:Imidazole glycerol phosphate synthase subunit HisF n=1 Tax=Dongia sedimenti TaxID=3064282 RepID=A0ABU0YNL6_9PROT|nr:imidazole glycerol phosphate synthase cyclase subunit [Rhodospirillaceae bacterium R-7]